MVASTLFRALRKSKVSKILFRHFSKSNIIQDSCGPPECCVPHFDINGKVALVTGASSGIGLACADALASRGAKGVMVTDIAVDRGKEAVKLLNKKYCRECCCFNELDVTKPKQFDEVFQKTVDTFGHIDILINNAGMLDETKWELMAAINTSGVVTGTLLGIEKYLVKYRSGCESIIVNMASILGLDPCAVIPIYTATKHFVMGLSRSYGTPLHYNKTKIRILIMCPGVTISPLVETVEDKVRADFLAAAVPIEFGGLPTQPVECTGMALLKMIDYGSSGSMWVTEAQEVYEVRTHNRFCRKRLWV